MNKLSTGSQRALLAAPGRTGARLAVATQAERTELQGAGLISPTGNLTSRGQRVRATIAQEMEDEAFGD
jgi:hypothetical protein